MQFNAGEKRRMKLIALAALNAIPLIGVLILGWSLVALLTIYWIELGVRLGFAAFEGAFAEGKPDYDANGFSWLVIGAVSEKRGGISIPGLPLSVQIANAPAIVMALVIGGVGWLLFGGIGVGGVSEATGATLSDSTATAIGLGIVAVAVGRAVEAGSYFINSEYESVSVQKPLQSALISVAGIGSALLVGGGFVIAGAPGPVVLVAVFVVKLLADIIDVYRERFETFDEQSSAEFGFVDKSTHWEPIDTEFDDSSVTVRPNRLALVVGGVIRGVRSPAALVLATPLCLSGLIVVASPGGSPTIFFGATAVLVGMFAVFGVFDRLCRYLCMEYRIAGDVVGYDRLFGPQWRLSQEQLPDADHTKTVTDRLFRTKTVLVQRGERTLRLPHLPPSAVEKRL